MLTPRSADRGRCHFCCCRGLGGGVVSLALDAPAAGERSGSTGRNAAHYPGRPLHPQGHLKILSNRSAERIFRTHPCTRSLWRPSGSDGKGQAKGQARSERGEPLQPGTYQEDRFHLRLFRRVYMTKAESPRITNAEGIIHGGPPARKKIAKRTTGTATPIHPRMTPAVAIALPRSPRLYASPIDARPRMTARILAINGITVIPRMPSIRDAMAFPSGAACGSCGACGLGSVDMKLVIGITSLPIIVILFCSALFGQGQTADCQKPR